MREHDEAQLRDVVTGVLNEQVIPRLDQINGRVGKTELRVDALESRIDVLEQQDGEQTHLLRDIHKDVKEIKGDLAPWVRREMWWQRGKQYTVRGYTISRRVIFSLGSLAAAIAGIIALLAQLHWM